MILQIGKLDRRITIQQLTKGVGEDYGEPTETWSDWVTVWANVYSGAGREFEQARQVNAEIDTQFQIRWRPGILATMRILYDGRYYDIQRIQEVGRRDRLNIWTKARTT
jgi:SPP1 family predicted phage head-tail adaptor